MMSVCLTTVPKVMLAFQCVFGSKLLAWLPQCILIVCSAWAYKRQRSSKCDDISKVPTACAGCISDAVLSKREAACMDKTRSPEYANYSTSQSDGNLLSRWQRERLFIKTMRWVAYCKHQLNPSYYLTYTVLTAIRQFAMRPDRLNMVRCRQNKICRKNSKKTFHKLMQCCVPRMACPYQD